MHDPLVGRFTRTEHLERNYPFATDYCEALLQDATREGMDKDQPQENAIDATRQVERLPFWCPRLLTSIPNISEQLSLGIPQEMPNAVRLPSSPTPARDV